MRIVAVTPSVVQDIVETAAEREFWTVVREHERPPFYHESEGLNNRLNKAARVVYEERITPNSDGSYTVEGSGGRTYRCAESCSCPNSQKSKSKWCYHLVATALYVEWQRRLHPPAPVVLGTLRAGTAPLPPDPDDDDALGNGYPVDDETLPLPLPPVSVEERLAQAARVAMDHVYDALPTPQEDRMPDDEYIAAPDTEEAPVAVLEPPESTPRPLPGPVLLPSLDARTLEQSMQAWSAQRQVVKRFLQQELVEGTDYYTLRIGGKATKPALSKAGSEKFMALFQLHATFSQDSATWTMLGQPQGTLCYVCTLHTRGGELIGEGRGARKLQQDNGDINKAVKMAQKSAMVDAILRTGALSDVFTQDLDDAPETPAAPPTPARTTSQELRQRIWKLVQVLAPEVRTREAVEAWVQQETGFALHPDHYRDILSALEAR